MVPCESLETIRAGVRSFVVMAIKMILERESASELLQTNRTRIFVLVFGSH